MQSDNGYFVIDIETCPIDLDKYFSLDEEGKKKLLNPIDSRIVAIGLKYSGENKIISGKEKKMLEDFWLEWKLIKKNPLVKVVGFNINSFDIPFLVTRSLIHNVPIIPFTLKEIIDLREKISAYKYGRVRGTLKEYARLIGAPVMDIDGSYIPELCRNNEKEKIIKYLENDLEITDILYKRARDTNITEISKW
jgi:uncharacterized protein YprB with RNaseH-like and TPR domain